MTGAEIAEVAEDSLAAEIGLEPGDRLLAINRQEIVDLIQFQVEWANEEVLLRIQKKNGIQEDVELEKDYDESFGAVFSQAVFNGIRTCKNKCLFCFVDQLPKRLRSSLYLKDDDYRLSFLQGSYVTLTNLSPRDKARIKNQHLSPLYVSVHATDPSLRCRLLGNQEAGQIKDVLYELSQAGIEFHTQVVLCPGYNDGVFLQQTCEDLLHIPGVLSLAIVPVGLTQHRLGLPLLKGLTSSEAGELVDWVQAQQEKLIAQRGTRFVWLSDEFYLLAGAGIPSAETYEDFVQLENGVGMIRLLWDEFSRIKLPNQSTPKKAILVTGHSGKVALEPIVARLNEISGVQLELQVVSNTFFGASVTVAGLLTGSCLLEGLKKVERGSTVIIPSVMIRDHGGLFLDGLKPQEVAAKLGIELIVVKPEAQALVEAVMAI